MLAGINHITLATADLPRAIAFYRDLLSFRLHASWRRGAYLTAPGIWLCLECSQPPVIAQSGHIAFSSSAANFPLLCARLRDAGTPQWRANSSEGQSIYFCDPDGHKLEIHVGSLATRLAACRRAPYEEMQFHEPLP